MAGPPPPPPLPPPPGPGKTKPAAAGLGRGALLNSIQSGRQLKKVTQINDRSSIPQGRVVDSNAASSKSVAPPPVPSSAGPRRPSLAPPVPNNRERSSSDVTDSQGPPQLAGILAGGMPKLRKTGGGVDTGAGSQSPYLSDPGERLQRTPPRPPPSSKPPLPPSSKPPLPPSSIAPMLPAVANLRNSLRSSTGSAPPALKPKPPIGKKPPKPPPASRKPSGLFSNSSLSPATAALNRLPTSLSIAAPQAHMSAPPMPPTPSHHHGSTIARNGTLRTSQSPGAPPPPPPSSAAPPRPSSRRESTQDNQDYDPYNYTKPVISPPPVPSAPPPRPFASAPQPPVSAAPAPPRPSFAAPPPPPPSSAPFSPPLPPPPSSMAPPPPPPSFLPPQAPSAPIRDSRENGYGNLSSVSSRPQSSVSGAGNRSSSMTMSTSRTDSSYIVGPYSGGATSGGGGYSSGIGTGTGVGRPPRINDPRFQYQDDSQLPKPRTFQGRQKLYRAGRGSSVPLDLKAYF